MIFLAGSGAADGTPGGLTVLTGPVGRHLVPVPELSFLALHPSGRWLYGVSGLGQGQVHAWRIEPDGGVTAIAAPLPSGGVEPCHLVVDPTGRALLVANYGGAGPGAAAVFSIATDGSLRATEVLSRETPPGPDGDRQACSHVHQIVCGPEGQVLVVDLGADEVVDYRLSDGRLTDPVVSATPAGAGPRHLVRLPDGRVLLSAELDSTLLRAREVDRRLVDWQVSPASGRAPDPGVRNYPSDLVLSADSASVYLANRGNDSIAALSVGTGAILAEMPCGAWPRQLALAGGRLYAAATNEHRVDVLDAHRLVPAGPPIPVGGPMCVVVAPDPPERWSAQAGARP